ncbi:RING finger domain protein [Aspergillus carlsbadensis]|nr:RING finger domain protein [Aspergillus carlsbadensis]
MGRAAASRTIAFRGSSSAVSKRKRAVKKESIPTPARSSRKRTKANSASSSDPTTALGGPENPNLSKKTRSSKGKKAEESTSERRARRFRKEPPKSFRERLDRAVTQRMFVVGQTVDGADGVPEMKFDIVGSTGNLYRISIGKEPTCNCPDGAKGNQCKHICYVLVKVLRAPTHLQYQLAFLSTELSEIYENSPLRHVKEKAEEPETDGKRKPVEGDCPICFMEFAPDKEIIIWCRAACGNNVHANCFHKWAATQNSRGVRCVYCRSPWQVEDADGKVEMDLEQLRTQGEVGEDGYVNVASQMGMSGERDYSTYHQHWVRRQFSRSGWHNRYESEDDENY